MAQTTEEYTERIEREQRQHNGHGQMADQQMTWTEKIAAEMHDDPAERSRGRRRDERSANRTRHPPPHEKGQKDLYSEIYVSVDQRVSRDGLWLLVWEAGGDPDDLTRPPAHVFIENHLSSLLAEEGIHLEGRPRERLEKRILGFDPHHPTPEEAESG